VRHCRTFAATIPEKESTVACCDAGGGQLPVISDAPTIVVENLVLQTMLVRKILRKAASVANQHWSNWAPGGRRKPPSSYVVAE
jgi:hypothetical protein